MPGNLLMDPHETTTTTMRGAELRAPPCFSVLPSFLWMWRPTASLVEDETYPPGAEKDSDSQNDGHQQQQQQHDTNVPNVQPVLSPDDTDTATVEARDDAPVAAACMAVCGCCDKQISRDWRFCAHCGMYLEHTTRRAAVLVCETNVSGKQQHVVEDVDLLEGYKLETPREEEPLLTTIVEGKPSTTKKEDIIPTVSSPEDMTTESDDSSESNASSSSFSSSVLGIDGVANDDSFNCVQDELLGDLE